NQKVKRPEDVSACLKIVFYGDKCSRVKLGGRVDFDDFVELMTPKLLAETAGMIGLKELKDAFREFDIDGDGSITSDELRHAMIKLLGEQTSRNEIDAVVREADNNGDGTVDFEEFVKMMSQK
ncbi:calcium-binding protein 5b, partial [Plectropomus leopardus]|uniref:calcium-binding protein 5b n=1 Tax=Plectropomus leopardus TaxID=160734 RepID=UPI001C4CDC5C